MADTSHEAKEAGHEVKEAGHEVKEADHEVIQFYCPPDKDIKNLVTVNRQKNRWSIQYEYFQINLYLLIFFNIIIIVSGELLCHLHILILLPHITEFPQISEFLNKLK